MIKYYRKLALHALSTWVMHILRSFVVVWAVVVICGVGIVWWHDSIPPRQTNWLVILIIATLAALLRAGAVTILDVARVGLSALGYRSHSPHHPQSEH